MKVNSIFKSINGEVSNGVQGRMCTFIRLQGCNLKCAWCDTKYAQDPNGGIEMTIPQIIKEVKKNKCKYITITGGEPLLQREELELLIDKLEYLHYEISVETNGSFIIPDNWLCDYWVVDYKLNSSGMSDKMIALKDFGYYYSIIKFVIGDKNDFNQAIILMKKIMKENKANDFAFSPLFGKVSPNELLQWMKDKNLNDCILNVQLHKLLNLDEPNI